MLDPCTPLIADLAPQVLNCCAEQIEHEACFFSLFLLRLCVALTKDLYKRIKLRKKHTACSLRLQSVSKACGVTPGVWDIALGGCLCCINYRTESSNRPYLLIFVSFFIYIFDVTCKSRLLLQKYLLAFYLLKSGLNHRRPERFFFGPRSFQIMWHENSNVASESDINLHPCIPMCILSTLSALNSIENY